MQLMSRGAAFIAVLLVTGAIGYWFTLHNTQPPTPLEPEDSVARLTPPEAPGSHSSPFKIAEPDAPSMASNTSQKVGPNSLDESQPDSSLPPVDITALGRTSISEDELAALVQRLKSDPELLMQLIDEMRQETDSDRLLLLSQILGHVGGESVTLLASEFIFSGDDSSRALGLELLQLVQPGNPAARDIVAGMLATEVEPQVLISTLTTLAVPGDVDDQSRAYLADQVAWLTDHEDASVRSISLDILSRWSADDQYTSVLLSGLDDESEYVRSSAAYALAGHEDQSPEVIERLMGIIVDRSETDAVRRASILALRRMPISDQQRAEIQRIEIALNTVTR